MDIRQIRYFLRIAELQSFTRAAADLHVAQPALSRQIRLLEEDLGATLLHRHGRGVNLTSEGTRFVERAAEVIAAFDRLGSEIRVGGVAPKGSLTLGMPISISHLATIPLLTLCRARLPGVALRIVEGHSELIADWVTSGSVELAVVFGDYPRPAITVEPLVREEIVAAAAEGTPWVGQSTIAATDLPGLPLILPRRPHATHAVLDRAGVRPRVVIEADTLVEIMDHVRAGDGVALMTPSSACHWSGGRPIRCMHITGPGLYRTIALTHATARRLTDIAAAVAPVIRDGFHDVARQAGWCTILPESTTTH